jgi:hypothetical protein
MYLIPQQFIVKETKMSVTAVPGNRVLILTGEQKKDDLVYKVDSIKRSIAFLICEKTGLPMKVHRSRIRKVLDIKEETMSGTTVDESVETDSTRIVTRALESEGETKTPKAKKSQESIPVDFNSLRSEGFEIWTKENLNFDVDGITVRAHCLIAKENDEGERASYEVFNTYNGSLGKKGTRGQTYHFSEKNTLEKKRKTLDKKGYVLFEG